MYSAWLHFSAAEGVSAHPSHEATFFPADVLVIFSMVGSSFQFTNVLFQYTIQIVRVS